MQKRCKRLLSIMIAAALIVGSMVMPANVAEAAANPELSKKSVDLLVGKSYDMNVKNKPANSNCTWTSSNQKVAVVNAKGVISGKAKGKATITCVVKTAKAQNTLTAKVTVRTKADSVTIKNAVTAMNAGNKFDLNRTLAPKASTDKTSWSSSDKSIATVNKNGVVTAKKPGQVVITAKTLSGVTDKNEILILDKEGTVATQSQLETALSSKAVSKVSLKTDKAGTFLIPAGAYEKIDLVVDAPKADVENSGTFQSITVKDIKDTTWKEKAKGNKFEWQAPNGRLVVEKGAQVSAVTVSKKDAVFEIVSDGTLQQVVLNTIVKLTLKGTGDKVNLIVAQGAKGAQVNSSLKLSIIVKAAFKIILEKGAEGTTIDKANQSTEITVENKTSSTITVTTDGEGAENIGAGTNTTIGGGSTDDSSSGSSGGSGGSSGGGGGNSTPTPTPDAAKAAVDAVNAAETAEALKEVLVKYADVLGIVWEGFNSLVPDAQTTVLEKLLKKNFADAAAVKAAFDEAVMAEAPGPDAIITITEVTVGETAENTFGVTVKGTVDGIDATLTANQYTVAWSVDQNAAAKGVAIDANGQLTIPAEYIGTITVTATVTAGDSEKTGTIQKTVSAAVKEIEVTGAGSIVAQTNAEVIETYTAVVKDQAGNAMNDINPVWSVESADLKGIAINANTGVVTVPLAATGTSITVIATVDSVVGKKEVAIVDQAQVDAALNEVNAATNAAGMKTAVEKNAAVLGLDLTGDYNGLGDSYKDAVMTELVKVSNYTLVTIRTAFEKEVAKQSLKQLVDSVANLPEADYSTKSWKAFSDAKKAANDAITANKEVDSFKTAKTALQSAKNGLKAGYTISGTVTLDEAGVNGRTVDLFESNGTTAIANATATTNANGAYTIAGYKAGAGETLVVKVKTADGNNYETVTAKVVMTAANYTNADIALTSQSADIITVWGTGTLAATSGTLTFKGITFEVVLDENGSAVASGNAITVSGANSVTIKCNGSTTIVDTATSIVNGFKKAKDDSQTSAKLANYTIALDSSNGIVITSTVAASEVDTDTITGVLVGNKTISGKKKV